MKKYVIIGSLGNTGKPIVQGVVAAGQSVSVITSNDQNVKEIESLGAEAIVGSLFDVSFVVQAFRGADAAYTMIPQIWKTDNWRASQNEMARAITEGIKSNHVKYVVNLSSLGAHIGNGCGPVDGLYDFEQLLNKVEGLNVKHLRPSSFYLNLLNQIGMIKQAGIMGANYGEGDQKIAFSHTNDIAKVALQELLGLNFTSTSVRHIYSDKRTGAEIANILGNAIGRQVPWIVFTDEQYAQGLLQAGLSKTHATAFTAMGRSLRTGKLQEELLKSEAETGSVKLEEFANEFKAAYNR